MATDQQLRREVTMVKDAERVLDSIINPPWVREKAAHVFPGRPTVRKLLGGFQRFEWTYQTIAPDASKLLEARRSFAAAVFGEPLAWDLNVHILLPSHLVDVTEPTQIRPAISWHGGGGFTGEPLFEDWIYTGELQFILSGNMISINPEYGLMPQSDSNAMRGNRSALLTWMFCHLQKELSKINKNITIDWSICYLFGGSFGGLMAIETWLEHEMHPYKPEQFCIRRIFVRDPMTHVYESNAQEFMGAPIDLAKALSDSDKMIGAFRSSPWTRPRGGTSPPYWMYCSVLLSKLRRWGEFFNGLCPYDNIKATKRCPDERTEWLVTHGDADMHVKVEDTIRMVELLKAQWPNMKVKLDIRCGKGHCSDYAEPLSEEQRNFLDAGA